MEVLLGNYYAPRLDSGPSLEEIARLVPGPFSPLQPLPEPLFEPPDLPGSGTFTGISFDPPFRSV